MKTPTKHLEGQGEVDYDFVNDILFFKVKDRTYDKSIEFENLVIDIDDKEFITGIQIFDASKFLQVNKESLRNIPKWTFQAIVIGENIEIRLNYETIVRNKTIEKNPIIVRENKSHLPSSEMICEV
ncbi:MAG: DUF2283 domain-containing protein [Nanoarchaeota archaeon]